MPPCLLNMSVAVAWIRSFGNVLCGYGNTRNNLIPLCQQQKKHTLFITRGLTHRVGTCVDKVCLHTRRRYIPCL